MRRITYATAAAAAVLSSGLFLSTPWPAAMAQAQQQDKTISATKLNLTMEQRYTIKEIVKGLKIENDRGNVQVEVGKVVPKSIYLHPMPAEISN